MRRQMYFLHGDSESNEAFTVVTAEREGVFYSHVEESPEITGGGGTLKESERAAVEAFVEYRDEKEDEAAIESFLHREAEGDVEWISLEEVRREFGLK